MSGSGRFAHVVQFVKFNIVGLLNTAVDFLLFALFLSFGVYYVLAQCLSYSAGILNSYILNNYWTFGRKTGGTTMGRAAAGMAAHGPRAVRFLLLNAGTLLLSLVLLYFLKDRMGLSPLSGKIAVTAVTLCINFIGSKLWVFRTRRQH